MDDFSRKLFVQLGDASKPVREKALDALWKYLPNAAQWFPDVVYKVEQGENYTALDVKYQEALAHNAQWAQHDQAMQQQITQLQQENASLRRRVRVKKSLTWMRLKSGKAAAGATVLISLAAGFSYITALPWPNGADENLRALAHNTPWGVGFNKPHIASAGSKPVWVMLRGEVNNTSFLDKEGVPIVMRCLHVFAVPAEPDSGAYRKVDPYNYFGWLRWPERVVQCQPSPDQKEAPQ